jgi:hypothetical protein
MVMREESMLAIIIGINVSNYNRDSAIKTTALNNKKKATARKYCG